MAAKDADLASFLTGSDFAASAAFIFGSDADFVDSALSEAIDRIQRKRNDLAGVERMTADVIAASPSSIIDFFDERALFGENRFLAISGVGEKHASIFVQLFKRTAPEPGPLLLIGSSALTSKSKVLAAARSSGFCRMIRAYEAPFTRQEVSARLSEMGVGSIDPDALDAAHHRLAPLDLATRTQTLRLLSLYARDGRLTLEELEACLPPTEDQLAGELLAGILSGDAKALIGWRRQGAAEGADPVAQLAIAARALGEARRARLASGGPPVFWKTDKIVKEAGRRLPDLDQRLERAIVAAHQLERAARSSESLMAEKTERLLLRLAQLFS